MEREELLDLLRNNEVTITFEKVDGSTRVMNCTLKQEYLPELKGSNHQRSDKVLPVWDIDNNGWRSFRLENLKSVDLNENPTKH